MVVIEEDPASKANGAARIEERDVTEGQASVSHPPPAYHTVASSASNASSSWAADGGAAAGDLGQSRPPLPHLKSQPTNFVSLSSEIVPIRGCYTIDPSLRVPSSLLPPLKPGEIEADRKNLSLESKMGIIDAEICLLHPNDFQRPFLGRANFSLVAETGSIVAKINPVTRPVPFFLKVVCNKGLVTLYLPATFHGSIVITGKRSVTMLSSAFSARAALISQNDTTRRYYVGDLSGESPHDCEVDVEMELSTLRVRYIEEWYAKNSRIIKHRRRPLLGCLCG